jgi:hypothetical protein
MCFWFNSKYFRPILNDLNKSYNHMGNFKIEASVQRRNHSTRSKKWSLQILCAVLLTPESYNQQYSDIIDINKLITLLENLVLTFRKWTGSYTFQADDLNLGY